MILYVTSFNEHLYKATGKNLIESFVLHKTEGHLLVTYEGDIDLPTHRKLLFHNLDEDSYLQGWLETNKDIIPVELGGIHEGEFEHKYHSRTSQWFRKIAALHHAVKLGYEKIIFLDCDVIFKKHLSEEKVNEVFDGSSVFYHLGSYRISKKKGIESGIIGFDMTKDGEQILNKVFQKYKDGSFKDYIRWDDSWMFTAAVEESPYIKSKDIVYKKGDDSHVVHEGELAPYLSHFKGIHWRKYGVNFK